MGEGVRWPSTLRPWRHLACSHVHEGSLISNHHLLHGTSRQTLHPKPHTLKPNPKAPRPPTPFLNPVLVECLGYHSRRLSALTTRFGSSGASVVLGTQYRNLHSQMRTTTKLASCSSCSYGCSFEALPYLWEARSRWILIVVPI